MLSNNLWLQQPKHLWKQRMLIFIMFIANLNLSVFHVKKINNSNITQTEYSYFSVNLFLPVLTFSGGAGGWNLFAQTRNASGCGLPHFTSGSSPNTIWLKRPKKSLCLAVFIWNVTSAELVATAMGMLCLCKWRISLSTPARQIHNFYFIYIDIHISIYTYLQHI